MTRIVAALALAGTAAAADWDAKAAAAYLDGRQQEWFAWPAANAQGAPCLSCHTGLPYLLGRQALRRALNESEPTKYESGLLNALRSRVTKRNAKEGDERAAQAIGVESVMAALLLANASAGAARLPAEAGQAFERLWSLQLKEGPSKGAWDWFSLHLDPWEASDSVFFGASLAAVAAGSTPAEYQRRAEVRKGVEALMTYLRGARSGQPLHNRIALLWASSKLPAVMTKQERKALMAEIARKQQADGGWTIASLGPFKVHPEAPEAGPGSNGYATAYTAFVLRQAGVGVREPVLKRALAWLRAHQDARSGAWAAMSMNKSYPAGSNQIRFMQDAATGYAAAALADDGGR